MARRKNLVPSNQDSFAAIDIDHLPTDVYFPSDYRTINAVRLIAHGRPPLDPIPDEVADAAPLMFDPEEVRIATRLSTAASDEFARTMRRLWDGENDGGWRRMRAA